MPAPTVRLFISSTFNDFATERDALAGVYGELDKLCREFGATFQPVDLRWGISPDACRDQQVVEVCLRELRQCQRLSPRPNFILLQGDRYGWRPLPHRIPAGEFELLASANPHPGFERWYARDDNACPSEYHLAPIADAEEWARAECDLREQFRLALDALGWPADDPRRRKYEIAVTHQEVLEGALEATKPVHDPRTHVFCYFRTTSGLPETASPHDPARNFADYLPDGTRDRDARDKLAALRHKLEEFPEPQRYNYAARWDGLSAVADLAELRARVLSDLRGVIEAELGGRRTVPPAVEERRAHVDFGTAARRGFTGQGRFLTAIRNYLNDPGSDGPLAIIGPPGAGKTALAAQAAAVAPRAGDRVIVRFLGTTPRSSDLRSLLADLCQHVADEYPGAGFDEATGDAPDLAREFRRRLFELPADAPLFILLDAVDQLDPDDGAHSLYWLPHELPAHVRVVVTVAAEERTATCVAAAEQVCGDRVLPLPGLLDGDPSALLDAWLAEGDSPRTVTPSQRDAVLARFREYPRPLFLRLLAEEARRWRSTDGVPELPQDTPDVLRVLFDRLERDANHGPVLVRAAMGYLVAARRGLSEPEVLDLLAADADVMADFVRRSPTEQRKPEAERLRRLPPIVWSRLVDELRPYLTERIAPGGMVLDFYHRQIRRAAELRYLTEENHRAVFAAEARYFAAQADFLAPGVPNGRKVDELPFLLYAAGDTETLATTLGGDAAFPFLEAKVAAGLVRDLVGDFLLAASTAPDAHPRKGHLRLLAQAVRRHAAFLERAPAEFLRCMWAECWWYDAPAAAAHYPAPEGGWKPPGPPWDRPGAKLHELLEAWRASAERSGPGRRWLRPLRPPSVGLGESGSVTLFGHTDRINDVVFEQGGSRAMSRSNDRTVRIWELATGREVRRMSCDASSIAFTSAGPRVVTTGTGEAVEVWDALTGARLFAAPPSDAPVQETLLSPDGRFLAVAAFEIAGSAYHHPGATEIQFIPKEQVNEVLETAFLRDGARVATVARRGSVRVWDLDRQRGFREYRLSLHAVEAMAFSPDGNVLSFALSGDAVHVYHLERNESLGELRADLWRVSQLVVGANGGEVFADTPEGWAIWSDLDAPPARQELPPCRRRFAVAERGPILALEQHADECLVVNLKTEEMARYRAPTPGRGTGPFLATDGRWMAAAGDQDHNEVRVWNIVDLAVVPRTNSSPKFAFSGDGSLVAGLEYGTGIRVCDARTGEPVVTLGEPVPRHVDQFRFSPDSRYLVADAGQESAVWDLHEEREIARVPHATSPIGNEFQGGTLWTLAAETDVRLWSPEQPARPQQFLRGHRQRTTVFAFAPTGPLAASGARDGTVCVWDTASGTELARIAAHDGSVSALCFSPDGRRLATGGSDRLVLVWDARTGEPIARTEGHEDKEIRHRIDSPYVSSPALRQTPLSSHIGGTVNAVAFSADGRVVASGSDDETVRVWDAESGEELARFSMPVPEDRTVDDSGKVRGVGLTPDGRVAAIGADHWFRSWDWRTGERAQHHPLLERFWSPKFSPNGDCYFFVSGREVLVCDSAPRGDTESFTLDSRPERLFFNQDGTQVVVVYESGGGTIWDRATRAVLSGFESQQGDVIGVRTDDEGLLFASQPANETTVRIDLASGSALRFDTAVDSVKHVALSPRGHRFATLAGKGQLRLHDAGTGQTLWHRELGDGSGVHFLSDDLLAVVGHKSRPARVWAVSDGSDREPTPAEAEQLERLGRTHPPGAAVRAWTDVTRIAPSMSGTEVCGEPGVAVGYEARFIEGRWLLVRGEQRPNSLTAGPTDVLAAAPDGRSWAVQTEDGWQLFALEESDPETGERSG